MTCPPLPSAHTPDRSGPASRRSVVWRRADCLEWPAVALEFPVPGSLHMRALLLPEAVEAEV